MSCDELMPKSEYYWEEPDYMPPYHEPVEDDSSDFNINELKDDLSKILKEMGANTQCSEVENANPQNIKEIKDPPRIRFQAGSMEKWIHALSQRLESERERVVELETENAELRATMARIVKILDGSNAME